ncbi:hypothetical protein [Sphaerisporangium rhizosphaerae]|uniref:Uncharacterized protein n=1 Tax=Sphaerisporangium rhizosphaerae TaxID=2269375 RepID=A0ABW2NZA8_9ACTN
MGVVYAKNDCVVSWTQGMTPLALGDVWDSEAPLVKERSDLFSAEPTFVRGRQERPASEAPVQRTTSAPGEKSQAKRRTS